MQDKVENGQAGAAIGTLHSIKTNGPRSISLRSISAADLCIECTHCQPSPDLKQVLCVRQWPGLVDDDGSVVECAEQCTINGLIDEMQKAFTCGRITITNIGRVDRGDGDTDQYVLIENKEGDLDPRVSREWLCQRTYRDTHVPGGYFCHTADVAPAPGRDENFLIGVIHHRYDI